MIHQTLKGRSISPLRGALLIVGLAVSIVLVSWIERAVALSTGFQYGSFAVWGLVVAEVMAVLRLSVMEYRYSLGEGRLPGSRDWVTMGTSSGSTRLVLTD